VADDSATVNALIAGDGDLASLIPPMALVRRVDAPSGPTSQPRTSTTSWIDGSAVRSMPTLVARIGLNFVPVADRAPADHPGQWHGLAHAGATLGRRSRADRMETDDHPSSKYTK